MANSEPLTLLEISEAAQKRVTFIAQEFTGGFEFIKNYPRSVTFFGSARANRGDPYYEKAKRLAEKIAGGLHYSVITGGGPGIMEAANRGAFGAGGNSLGLTIDLPREQMTNQYLTDREDFHYFFSRKVCLAFSAEAYVFFPGGFGTLDEFLEILTLIQTNKIPQAPIILVGVSFWTRLQEFFKEVLLQNKMIGEKDIHLYIITDDEDEILNIIKKAPIRLGLKFDENSEEAIKNNSSKFGHEPLSGLLKKFGW
jgi:uncharacterized protein (TIGR00730 family)